MFFQTVGTEINLQATLSASSATANSFIGGPHHPITCSGDIFYEEDGTFRCPHSTAAPNEERTQSCLNHSMAILLIELARGL